MIGADFLLHRHLRPRVHSDARQRAIEDAVEPVGQAGENVAVEELRPGVGDGIGGAIGKGPHVLLILRTFARRGIVEAQEVEIV